MEQEIGGEKLLVGSPEWWAWFERRWGIDSLPEQTLARATTDRFAATGDAIGYLSVADWWTEYHRLEMEDQQRWAYRPWEHPHHWVRPDNAWRKTVSVAFPARCTRCRGVIGRWTPHVWFSTSGVRMHRLCEALGHGVSREEARKKMLKENDEFRALRNARPRPRQKDVDV